MKSLMKRIDAQKRPEDTKLNEYDKEEWWDVMHHACPELSREAYDLYWEAFQKLKQEDRGNPQ